MSRNLLACLDSEGLGVEDNSVEWVALDKSAEVLLAEDNFVVEEVVAVDSLAVVEG